ncbi:hypothetical protein Tco_1352440 [Tanacetum coccineum]
MHSSVETYCKDALTVNSVYLDGERLTQIDEKTVVEKLLAYHPHSEDKIGCGLDSIMVRGWGVWVVLWLGFGREVLDLSVWGGVLFKFVGSLCYGVVLWEGSGWELEVGAEEGR